MTVLELLEQAKNLTPTERHELARLLMETTPIATPITGAQIVARLRSMPPIALAYPEIEDPVAWVEAIRATQQRNDWGDEENEDQ